MGTHIVTGVAGFIGSHLAEALLKRGDKVIGIDQFNDYYNPKFKRKNISYLQRQPSFALLEANIEDLNWESLLEGIDVVFHQAAQAGVRASWGEGFRQYTQKNLNATQIILEAAKETNSLKRLVYASSSSVYGDAETMPTSESVCPKPVSPYGITKLAAEQICHVYHRNFGVPVTSLRYFTVYGPRQRPDMAFHKFFKAVIQGEAISIYGDGQQTRDFTFVSDAVAANLAAADVSEAIGEIFNIGGGNRVVLADVIETMERVIEKPIAKNYIERAKGDARHTSADVSKARKILDYNPKVPLEQGLSEEWQWIKNLY
ncbi:MAG: NAD-dependent epimerase/dehydratase family protein [Xenococcaceae cyanobacterium MO_234.B1]|nr:NAD-dependent epimerase/dehydratase family protein [Xenococcaceae cyanobacterium MO_234.B1]